MAPLSTRVTATLANAPEHRSIFGQYAQTPIYHKPVTVEAPLDEKGCLSVELPLTEAKMVSFGPQREVKLFLEPGDQLHVDADVLNPSRSLRFSGQGAANNQLLAALRSRFPRLPEHRLQRLGGRCLSPNNRPAALGNDSLLDEGCSQYQLTPAFIDYYRAEITYEWAKEIVSYPRNYDGQNGRKNEAIPDDYFDTLNQVELVDETAIGTSDYRTFLSRNFLRLWIEWNDQPATKQMATEERRNLFETYVPYNHAKRTLHGKVLYFFLAGEIVM